MELIMFLMVAGFVIIAYFFDNRNLISPWFLLCLAVFAPLCIVLLNFNNWEVEFNEIFVLYVCTALLAFGLGAALVRCLHPNAKLANSQSNRVTLSAREFPKKYPVNLFLILSVLFSFGYIFKLFYDVGGAASFGERIRVIYEKIVYENYSPGTLFTQFFKIVGAIAYLNTYRLLAGIFSKRDRMSIIKLLIPIVLLLITAMVSSDRNVFLRYAIYAICLYVLFFCEHCKKKQVNLIIIRRVLLMGVLVLVVFFLFGKIKQYQSDIWRSLSIYGGSGLYNFNLWIKDFNGPYLYGGSTFSTFLNALGALLKPLGITIGGSEPRFDSYIEYAAANGYIYSSNIYAALKPYVEDFGYFGAILFPFILGMFFEWLFLKAKSSKFGFSWIMYCVLIYPVIYFSISEQGFRRFHFGLVYELFWIMVLYFIVYGRKKRTVHSGRISTKKETNNAE